MSGSLRTSQQGGAGGDSAVASRAADGAERGAEPVSHSPASRAPAPPAPRAPNRAPLIVGVVALVFVAVLARQWLLSRGSVGTENAQVAGHVIPVLARVPGFVTGVEVRENQEVRQGDVLVTIDDRDLRVRLAQNDADLRKEIANAGSPGKVGQAVAQIAAARASEAQMQALVDRARSDQTRMQTLAARGIVSQQQLDAAEAASRGADAQLAAAREQVVAAEAALTGADARVASARAAREQAALQLSFTTVIAPAAGVVSRKNVEVGQLVQSGQPLMTVVPLDDVWIVANLKETEIRGVTPGARADVTVDSYPGRRFSGHVESVSPATGATFSMLPPDNATGNFTKVVQRIPVRIRLDGEGDPVHPLRPGMSAVVRIRVK